MLTAKESKARAERIANEINSDTSWMGDVQARYVGYLNHRAETYLQKAAHFEGMGKEFAHLGPEWRKMATGLQSQAEAVKERGIAPGKEAEAEFMMRIQADLD